MAPLPETIVLDLGCTKLLQMLQEQIPKHFRHIFAGYSQILGIEQLEKRAPGNPEDPANKFLKY